MHAEAEAPSLLKALFRSWQLGDRSVRLCGDAAGADGAEQPAGLCSVDQLVGHGDTGRMRSRPFGDLDLQPQWGEGGLDRRRPTATRESRR